MSFIELFIIAIGLSMDAFAVAVCEGLSMKKLDIRRGAIMAIFFGAFQAGMPVLGYLLGNQFQKSICHIDHWIAFVLLGLIGVNMIKESLDKEEGECKDNKFNLKYVLILSIATSIDALAVGVTFAFLQVNIIHAVTLIGLTTFILSFLGVKIGNVFGCKYKSKAEFFGGCVLIIMGLKILLDHCGVFEKFL